MSPNPCGSRGDGGSRGVCTVRGGVVWAPAGIETGAAGAAPVDVRMGGSRVEPAKVLASATRSTAMDARRAEE